MYNNENMSVNSDQSNARIGTGFMSKVLLWMCLGLIVTFIFAFLVPYMVYLGLGNSNTFVTVLYAMTGVGAVGVLIISIIMMFKRFSTGVSPILYVIYTALMGLCLSPLFLLGLDPIGQLGLIYALLVTAGVFGVMALIGVLSKGRLNSFAVFIIGLAIGSLILSLVNLFFFNEMVYWIVSFMILIIFMLYTAIDFNRISKLNALGAYETNLAVSCALTLYSDFIILFLRILPFVLQLLADRR